jgi:hypothetical protein
MTFLFSDHAIRQMVTRKIPEEIVLLVLGSPDQIITQDQSTTIYMKLIDESDKQYLYRLFVNTSKNPPLIITAYKTSKIDKYGYSIRQRT